MLNYETEVLIVGAGPTGLMLACDLQRRGIPFQIIDRAKTPSLEARAVAIQARSLEIFRKLGLFEQLLDQGVSIEGVRTYKDRKLSHRFSVNTASDEIAQLPYLLTLEQHVTESILLNHLKKSGVEVQRGVELKRLENRTEEVRSWLVGPPGEHTLSSEFVVGCDGSRSSIRKLSGIVMKGANLNAVYRIADVEVAWDLPSAEILRFPKGDWEMVATPLPGAQRYRLNMCEPAPYSSATGVLDYGTLDTPPCLETFESRLQEISPCALRVRASSSLLSYRVSFGIAQRYRSGRIFLAGDSAHLIPQSAAHGMNMGLQDAHNLGWKLGLVLRNLAPRELLDSYGSERRQVALETLLELSADRSSAYRATHLASRANLDRWSQLHLKYRTEPPLHREFQRPLLTGSRAPDGTFEFDGSERSLRTLLIGYQYHLLIFSKQDDMRLDRLLLKLREDFAKVLQYHVVGITNKLVQTLPRVYQARHGDLVLIRPDGFIDISASLNQTGEFLSHLERTFNRGPRKDEPETVRTSMLTSSPSSLVTVPAGGDSTLPEP